MEPVETKYPTHPILIVDDETHAVTSLRVTLQAAGINHVITCEDSRQVFSLLKENEIEAVLLDLMMPHISGKDLLAGIVRAYPDVPVIMITGIDEVDMAVRCIQEGGFDYILKTSETGRLISSVKRAIEIRELRLENSALKHHFIADGPERPEKFTRFISHDRSILRLFRYCEAIAPVRHPVLITGETGAGKNVMAEIIHTLSARPGRLVEINTAGLDDRLFSDTLFGHGKGAFTGANRARQGLLKQAEGGTLFLDEIGDLSGSSQVKLLLLLEKSEYLPLGSDFPLKTNARFIAATNKDLRELVDAGSFRSDLFYRLNMHHIRISPLRERPDDIPFLFEHFLEMAARAFGKNKPNYDQDVLTALGRYSFPGNIRELKSMVFDAVGRLESNRLTTGHFEAMEHLMAKSEHRDAAPPAIQYRRLIRDLHLYPTLKEATHVLIEEAMRRSGDNQRMAAGLLGITPQALNQRLKKRS